MRKTDLAYRSELNPLIKPQDLAPMIPGMEIACIFNPGVFRFNNKTCLLLRVAERPIQDVYKRQGNDSLLSSYDRTIRRLLVTYISGDQR